MTRLGLFTNLKKFLIEWLKDFEEYSKLRIFAFLEKILYLCVVMRRERKNNNKYPNFSNIKREVTSVLRDIDGFMVFSEMINGQLFYRKTNLKDINIKPDKTGRRRFNKGKHLSKHIIST